METKLVIKTDGDQAIALIKQIKTELAGVDKELLKSANAGKKLTNENAKLEKSLAKTNTQLKQKEAQLEKTKSANDKLRQSLKEMKDDSASAGGAVTNLNNTMRQLRNVMLGLAAIRFVGGIVNQINQVGDAAVNIDAKLTNAIGSASGINDVFDELARQARGVGTSVETNVDLFQRLARATKELKTPQEQILELTRNINNAFVVSGASAQETRNAIIQLSQGFSAGALRGDEFRAVMEQAPALIDALKDSLNVTQGELIDLAFDGQLTSDLLVTAFTEMGDEIDEQVKNIPLTVERAFENLRTAFIETTREGNISADFNKAYAESIQFIADNLNTILTTAVTSLATGALVLLVKALKAGAEWLDEMDNRAKLLSATIKTLGFGAVVAGITYLVEESRRWDEHLEEIRDNASKLPKELQKSVDVLRTINEFNAFGDTGNAINQANERLREFGQNSQDIVGRVQGITDEINSLQSQVDEFFRTGDLAALTDGLVPRDAFDRIAELEAELKGLGDQYIETQTSAFDFFKTVSGEGIDLSSGNELLQFLYEIVNAGELATQKELEAAQARAEAEAARSRANESIQKQIESLRESNEALQLELVRVTEGTLAYQQLSLAKISALNVDKKLKAELIALTKEQFRLNASIEKNKQEAKDAEAAERELNKTRGVANGLLREFGSVQDRISAIFREQAQKLEELKEAGLATPEVIAALNNETEELLDNVTDLGEATKEIDFGEMFDGFAASLNPINSALQQFKDELKVIDELTKSGNFTAGQQAFFNTGLAAEFALNSMAEMAQEGSDAQKKLAAAAAITNTILGIKAILTQGEGDPYTAFARMASMAALVASLGVQVAGAFGGSGGGGAEQQQEIQGTGTVLGDAAAKSESIENSLDLIANASEKIVGINSKMLRSLNSMNDAISGTVTEIAKLGEIGNLGTRASSALGGLDSFLFGSSKVTDRGIQLLGGGIADAIDGSLFQAYEIAKKRGLFGSSRRTNTAPLEEGITNQIALIFESMTDTILSGAEALGVNMADVQRALDTFRIEEQRISLLDLNADDQRAELEAVFSSIFDNLTEFSIPFITQFQEAGEGLGETLSRVATTVLVFEEAIGSMGLDFIAKQVDPELFAQAAVAISDFAGGMEEFIDGYSTYVSKFLSENEQIEIITGRISGIFGDLGLALPSTREGFTELIQSLDLTTEAGQEAFGTLISLSSEMDSFYAGLEAQQEEYRQSIDEFMGAFFNGIGDLRRETENQLTEVQASLVSLGLSSTTTMEQFRQEFMAALPELTPAETQEWVRLGNALADANRAANDFANSLLQQARSALSLRNALQQSAFELFGVATSLSQINQQISILEQQTASTLGTTLGGVQQVANAGSNMFEAWQDALFDMERFLDGLLVDQRFSPLSPQQQLQEALSQFDELAALAQGGDLDAYNELQSLITTILGLNQDVNASGQDYRDIFDYVTGIAAGITAPDIQPTVQPVVVTGPVTVNPIDLGVSEELQALYDRRDEIESQNFASQIFQFADTVRQYMELTRQNLDTVLLDLGVSVDDMFAGLNINFDELDANMLASLSTLANVLGIELSELTEQIGVDAGNIIDANSIINEALEVAINSLPDQFQTEIAPLFEALEAATSPEAQEAALQALLASVGELPVEWRDQLAPFFDDIDVTTEAGQQLLLLEAQNGILGDIMTALSEGIVISEFLNPPDFGVPAGTVDDPGVVVIPDPVDTSPVGGVGNPGSPSNPVPSAGQFSELISRTSSLLNEMNNVEGNTGQGVLELRSVGSKIDGLTAAFNQLSSDLRNS